MSDFRKCAGYCKLNNELLNELVDLNNRVVAMNKKFADIIFKEEGVPDRVVPHPHEVGVSKGPRRKRCGVCGTCISCLNMVKFGGSGCRKQACVKRTCRHLYLSLIHI